MNTQIITHLPETNVKGKTCASCDLCPALDEKVNATAGQNTVNELYGAEWLQYYMHFISACASYRHAC
ncbi:MAG: hypothetical protein ACO1OO_07305 [Flavisolibacter sp.]